MAASIHNHFNEVQQKEDGGSPLKRFPPARLSINAAISVIADVTVGPEGRTFVFFLFSFFF